MNFKKIVKNKYIWVTLFFILWLLFFDNNNFFDQWKQRGVLNKLEEEAAFYEKEIEKNKKEKEELFSKGDKNLEKFAREKYYMKKPGEDLYIIIDTTKKSKP